MTYLLESNKPPQNQPKSVDSKNKLSWLEIALLALGIALTFHAILVVIVSTLISSTIARLFPAPWWDDEFNIFSYILLWSLSVWVVVHFYKSFFFKTSKFVILIICVVGFLMNYAGGYINRSYNLENKYICNDNPEVGLYLSSSKMGRYKKKVPCTSVRDNNLFGTAYAISEGKTAQRIGYTDHEKVAALVANENGVQKIFVSLILLQNSKINGQFYDLYYGGGVGNNGSVEKPDFLVPATQEMIRHNAENWRIYEERLRNEAISQQRLREQEEERRRSTESKIKTERQVQSNQNSSGTEGMGGFGIIVLILLAFFLLK